MEMSPENTRMLLETKVYYQVTGPLAYKFILHICISVAYWSEKFWMGDQRDSVPSILKSVFLLCAKTGAVFRFISVYFKILLFPNLFFHYFHN